MFKQMTIALAAVALFAVGACNQDPTSSTGGSNELVLAQNAQSIANSVAATPGAGTTWEGWVRRLLDTLRTTDDPEARAFLDSARMNRDSAWAAWQRGDTAAARAFRRAAFAMCSRPWSSCSRTRPSGPAQRSTRPLCASRISWAIVTHREFGPYSLTSRICAHKRWPHWRRATR